MAENPDPAAFKALICVMDDRNLLLPGSLSGKELEFCQTSPLVKSVYRPSERNFGFQLTKLGMREKARLLSKLALLQFGGKS